jgi:alanine-alpha-ketoisovalerate/valine-pyruvate aminotransferase
MIVEKESTTEIIIDLTGPQGNAFYLLGTASKWCKKLGYDQEETDELLNDMKSSDYHHLVNAFDNAFGHFVILQK